MGAPRARSGLWRHREAGPARARLERHYRGADATSPSLGHASAFVSLDLDAQTAAEELHLPLRQCPCICLCIGPEPFDRQPLDCDLTARSASGVKDAELPTGMPPPLPRRLFCCTQCTSACDATLCAYYDVDGERHHRQHECWRYCKCVAACCSGMTSPTAAYHAPCSAAETRSCTSATLPAPSPPPSPFPILATPTLSFPPPITIIVPPFPLPTTILPPFPCPSICISCCLCAPRPVPTDFPSSAPPLPSSTLPTSPPPTIAPFPPFPPSPSPTLTPPPSLTLPTSTLSTSVSSFFTAPLPCPPKTSISTSPSAPPTVQTPARPPALAPAQIIGIFAGALVLAGILWGILLSRRAAHERALIAPQLDGRTDRRSGASWVLSLRGVSGTGTFAGSLYRRIERGMSVQSGVTRRPGSEESSAMV